MAVVALDGIKTGRPYIHILNVRDPRGYRFSPPPSDDPEVRKRAHSLTFGHLDHGLFYHLSPAGLEMLLSTCLAEAAVVEVFVCVPGRGTFCHHARFSAT